MSIKTDLQKAIAYGNNKIKSNGGISDAGTIREVIDNIDSLTPELVSRYGIEWDITVSNPKCTRIGNMELHRSLPIQSKMRRCLLLDNGDVNYYLDANDSTKKEDGTPANLDGSDGQVMVEIPDMYIRFETDGNKCRCLMSEQALPGFIKWSKDYVSAYEATVERAANKLASVVNTTVAYRGGANTAAEIAHDLDGGSSLGKPATNISLTNFRAYARNRGSVNWNCYTYQIHRKLWWLFAVEYANFNSQDTFNAELTADGCRQGAFGEGVTDLVVANLTNMTGGTYSCIPCGISNSLGNRTGVVAYTMPIEYGIEKITNVPSYRGIENPFGHIWKGTDGCRSVIMSDDDGGESEFYVCDYPPLFSISGIENYEFRGVLPNREGFVKVLMFGEYGEIMPSSIGASSTTYFCDYYYTIKPSSGKNERGVLIGGHSNNKVIAGLLYIGTHYSAATQNSYVGSRLCFIP